MNNPKRIVLTNDVFTFSIKDFESGKISELYEFHNCLLYLIQPTTYSPGISLATVCLMRNDKVIRDWRARISNLTSTNYVEFKSFHLNSSNLGRQQTNKLNYIYNFGDDQASILDERESYRELLEITGPAIAKKLLLRAHDAPSLHAFKPKSQLYKKITKDSSLNGLITNDSEFYTYISLKLIFEEPMYGRHQLISELKSTLSTTSKGANSSALELTFNFSHSASPIALPINVIIGANGIGKTRALHSIARVMIGERPRKSPPRSGQYLEAPTNPVVVFSHEPQRWHGSGWGRLKHISLSISGSEWRKLPAVTQEISLLEYSDFSLNTLNKILNKVINTASLYLKMVGQKSHNYSLDELSRQPGMCARIDLSAEYKYFDDLGVEHPLSSGQRAMICFCFNVVLHCKQRTVLLIDEPENHLHPRFISILMQTLHSVLLATESVAIIATHSPFVVREVDRSGVLILQESNHNIPLLFRPGLQTLGGDVSLISDFVFEDIDLRKGYQESIDQALLACRTAAARKDILDQFSALGLDAAAYARSLEK